MFAQVCLRFYQRLAAHQQMPGLASFAPFLDRIIQAPVPQQVVAVLVEPVRQAIPGSEQRLVSYLQSPAAIVGAGYQQAVVHETLNHSVQFSRNGVPHDRPPCVPAILLQLDQ